MKNFNYDNRTFEQKIRDSFDSFVDDAVNTYGVTDTLIRLFDDGFNIDDLEELGFDRHDIIEVRAEYESLGRYN